MTGDKVKPQDALSTSSAGPLPATSNSSGGGNGSGSEQFQKEQHQEKLQTLKQRKFDLEKLLNEKNLLLEQIQRQEQQIIAGDHIFDMNLLKGNSTGNIMNLRKKINTTSFKLPNSNKGMMYATKERSGSVGDMEKKLRQEIVSTQSHKLPAVDVNLSKSMRSMPYTEYDTVAISAAQQKLLLKRQQQLDCSPMAPIQPIIDLSSADINNFINKNNQNLSIAVDYNKNSSMKLMNHSPTGVTVNQSQRYSPIPLLTASNNNSMCINRANPASYVSERRNSIKSMQQHKNYPSPKQHRQDDRLSMVVNSSAIIGGGYGSGALTMPAKINRSDYDLINCNVLSAQHTISTGIYPYESDNSVKQDDGTNAGFSNDSVDSTTAVHANLPAINSNRTSSIPLGNSFVNTNNKVVNCDSALMMRLLQQSNFGPHGDYEDSLYSHQRSSTLSGRKSAQISTDMMPMRPLTSIDIHSPQTVGLGGYWKTLGAERIWCTVDTSYDSSSMQQSNAKLKKSAAITRTTPTKSISLGNFDIIGGDYVSCKDELVDKISISSMNSEGNKKKEKQWLETSLDGPLATTVKSQQPPQPSVFSPHSIAADVALPSGRPKLSNNNMQPIPTKLSDNLPQQLRQTSNKILRNPPPNCGVDFYETAMHPSHPHYRRITPTIKSKSPLPDSNTPQITPTDASTPPIMKYQPPPVIANHPRLPQPPQRSPTPQFTTSSSPTPANNPRSPSNPLNLTQHDLIRIESPKNMTVVQQAVFMPYKEVTKPFEMSDFYKYSTKFRQKDKQSQQVQHSDQIASAGSGTILRQQQIEVEQ